MAIDLYYVPASPPCRVVMLVAKAVGIPMNMKFVNMMEGEHMKPEFIQLNPEHTLPTINDNGFVLWESRAIIAYLVNQYAKNDSLYPKDPKERAEVDQKLYFDATSLYNLLVKYFGPVVMGGNPPDENVRRSFEEKLHFLDACLENKTWVAGNNMTIADIALFVTINTAKVVGIDVLQHKNIETWYECCRKQIVGYEDIEMKGANMLGQFFKNKLP